MVPGPVALWTQQNEEEPGWNGNLTGMKENDALLWTYTYVRTNAYTYTVHVIFSKAVA